VTWIGTLKKRIKKKKTVEVSVQCGNAIKREKTKQREMSIKTNEQRA